MQFWRILLLTVALAAASLFAFACDEENGDGDGEESEATEEPSNGDGEGEATEEPSDGEEDGDGSSSLEDLDIKAMTATYDVTAGGETTTYNVFVRDATAWRFDLVEGGATTTFIQTADGVLICAPDSQSCIQSPGGLATIPVPFFAAFAAPGGLNDFVNTSFAGVDSEQTEETIAGRDATCYTVSGEGAAGGFASICVADGLVLRWEGGIEGSTVKVEATSIEEGVDDVDLEPPYEVQEIPGLYYGNEGPAAQPALP
jgi:hypothetical protein